MDKSTLIIELLEEYWSDECDAAGSSNVQDIAEGNVTYESAEGGSYLDLTEVLTILAAAATFVRHTIDIYETLKKKWNKKPQDTDLKSEMTARNLEPEEIDKATRNKVYKAVSKKLENESIEENRD